MAADPARAGQGCDLGLSPAAEQVRRDDPVLFRTALYAREPARARLMTLYAVDIELSRATEKTLKTGAGPLIAQMRLQWWRDRAEAARAGEPAADHPIAGPAHPLFATLPAALVDGLIEARERELDGIHDDTDFAAWRRQRFEGLTRLGLRILSPQPLPETDRTAQAVGAAIGTAFALRHAQAMARQGVFLLPGLDAEGRSRLARGEAWPSLQARAKDLAGEALERLAEARKVSKPPRSTLPALLPLAAAEPALRAASVGKNPAAAKLGTARLTLALLWRAVTGRW
ncbi:MAG: squalene/phytoene synthase family protein [Pseudomonadota bacterium]